MKKAYIRDITYIALFVAVLSILAQISIPVSVIPITLQGFAVALCGYTLNRKKATIAITVYLLLGAVGAPVFASFKGGFYVLLSYTGGFLWGFIPYALLCALSKGKKAIFLGIIGVLSCHALGVIQYSLVSKASIWLSLAVVSLPYLLKDIALTIFAYFVANQIKKVLTKER